MWYIILIIIIACEPLPTSPFDSGYEKDLWTPTDFQIEVISVSEVKLSWAQEEMNITGFKIDRKIGEADWIIGYAILNKDQTSWRDESPSLASTTYYRLYAYANEHISIYVEENINLEIPPPTNLESQVKSLYKIKLDWSDNSSGEDGFKIDRKLGNEDWMIELASLAENDTTWTDTSAVPNTIIKYRVYAYRDEYNSASVMEEVVNNLSDITNFQVIQQSTNSVKLIWTDNNKGEEGFIIDRRVEDGDWESQYSVIGENTEMSLDIDIDLWNRYYYRMYAFYHNYISNSVEDSIFIKTSDEVRVVPFEYSSVYQAMDYQSGHFNISEGDTILILPGTYDANINFYGVNIVLCSLFIYTGEKAYIEQTILDGGNTGNVITIDSGENSSCLVSGFTIQNGGGYSSYGGIYISDSSPKITHNIISGNRNGIRCFRSSSQIINNMVANNNDVGIRLDDAGSSAVATLINNNIYSNTYGMELHGSSASIINNNICNNYVNGFWLHVSSPTIENTIISSNGSNFYFANNNNPQIKYSCVEGGFPSQGTNLGGNIYEIPLFVEEEDFHLKIDSPCRDSGNPDDLYNDINGSRNDMGAYGGPNGNW